MKKFILLVCIIFSMSALVAYAMTIEPIYTCIDGYTIYSGYTMDDIKKAPKSCSYTVSDKTSETYNLCNKKFSNINNLSSAGKCEISNYRASLKFQNETCSFDFDVKRGKITGSSYSKFENKNNYDTVYSVTGYNEKDNKCLQVLAKSLKAKYPHIKGNPLYGFEEDKETMLQNTERYNSLHPKTEAKTIQNNSTTNYIKSKPNQNQKTLYKCGGYINGSYASCSTYDPTDSSAKPVCKTLYKQGKCYRLNH